MNCLTIRNRLFIILGVLSVLLFVLQAGAYYAINQMSGGLVSIYEDRVVPMRDLKAVADAYAVTIVDTAHSIRGESLNWAEGKETILAARQKITETWVAYSRTVMTDEEKDLAGQAQVVMGRANALVERLVQIISVQDKSELVLLVDRDLYPAINPVSAHISQLVDLQLRVTAQIHTEQVALATLFNNILIISLLVVVVILGMATNIAQSSIVRPLGQMTEAMTAVASGNLHVATPGLGRQDEIGAMADALEVFKSNRAVSE